MIGRNRGSLIVAGASDSRRPELLAMLQSSRRASVSTAARHLKIRQTAQCVGGIFELSHRRPIAHVVVSLRAVLLRFWIPRRSNQSHAVMRSPKTDTHSRAFEEMRV